MPHEVDHAVARAVMMGLIAGVVGILIVVLLSWLIIAQPMSDVFNQTATTMEVISPAMATLMEQTYIANTEQFVMTQTAHPWEER